jgi:hypothetical protein
MMTSPDLATVSNGFVTAGSRPGKARVFGDYGGLSVEIPVEIEAAPAPHFTVWPVKPLLQVGEAASFQALSSAGPVAADWTTSSSSVALHLANGVFRAISAGQVLICASAPSRRACTTVEVKP